jgi:hypothetical protein
MFASGTDGSRHCSARLCNSNPKAGGENGYSIPNSTQAAAPQLGEEQRDNDMETEILAF